MGQAGSPEGRRASVGREGLPGRAGARLRVVHCIDSFGAGGTELNLVRTLERLDQDRFDLTVVVLNPAGPLRPRIERLGIPIHAFPVTSFHSLGALRRAAELVRLLRSLRPHVVHCHDRYTNLFGTLCARLAGVPLTIASRRWWTAMPRPLYGAANRLAYRASHRVLANSATVARLMTDHEGLPHGKVVVLPNFVEEAAFAAIGSNALAEARRGFGIPEDAFVITAVAVFRPEKSLETLIAAVKLLARQHPRLHVLLVGSGPCEAALRGAARDLGVADRVHFPGFLTSPPNPHGFGDMSVLCSLHEGFPNSIVEAMAAGKAVVATAVGGIPDAVEAGVTGLLVPPRSPVELAAAIDTLIRNEALRRAFGEAGRRRARGAFGQHAVLTALEKLYRQGARTPVPDGTPIP